jgi:hypothetical protein
MLYLMRNRAVISSNLLSAIILIIGINSYGQTTLKTEDSTTLFKNDITVKTFIKHIPNSTYKRNSKIIVPVESEKNHIVEIAPIKAKLTIDKTFPGYVIALYDIDNLIIILKTSMRKSNSPKELYALKKELKVLKQRRRYIKKIGF